MVVIARGQSSSAASPLLAALIVLDGVLVDPISLEFVISERVSSRNSAAQVYPSSGRAVVDLVTDKLANGRYVAAWTVAANALVGEYEITWYFTLEAGGIEYTYTERFDVVAATRISGPIYASVQSMRDEGLNEYTIPDDLLHQKLVLASRQVEAYTGRSFFPQRKVVNMDGTGAASLLLQEPIVAIESIEFESELFTFDSSVVSLDNLRVYNRHITQNLLDPDDRDSPRIEWNDSYLPYGSEIRYPWVRRWPLGKQNVKITGVFGYTEANGTPTGGTPLLIQLATRLLMLRELPALTDTEGRFDARDRWKLTSERTKDQAYTLFSGVDAASRAAMIGPITGDPAIDNILVMFRRPPHIAAV